MRKKFIFSYTIIISVISFIIIYISIVTSQKYLDLQVKSDSIKNLELLCDILQNKYMDEDNNNLSEFVNTYSKKLNFRITLIDYTGKVISDSDKDIENLDNHSQRIEFKQALENNIGYSTRYSESIGTFCLYYAKKVDYKDNSVILRISVPLTILQSLKSEMLNSSIGGIVIAIIISIIMSIVFSNIFLKPIKKLTYAVEDISKGNYDKKIFINSNDEIGKLTSAFNLMARELKYTVLQLNDRNIKLESILDSMTNGVIAMDKNYNIILLNNLCFKLLDISDVGIINKPFYEVIRNQGIFDLIEEATDNKRYITKELKFGKNSEKILRISINPILSKDDDNKNIGILLVIEDITKIRKLENMRRDFVSNVTHELKTPLTSIKGFVDTLKNGALNDMVIAERFLNIIDIEAERLYNLIQEILTLSEIETRDKDINITRVNAKQLVDEIKKILEPLAIKKGIRLNFSFEVGLLDLICNKERIYQLLFNLIDNAIKYTEKGSINISFSNVSNNLNIIVKDNGIGIPEESIPRLFERFYRVDNGRSRKIGGTGLGLSIVKHIIILYNGKIEVKSELGKGSEFKVILPIFCLEK